MGDPISTSRGRSTNRGIKAQTTSMCKNEDGCSNEKSVKNSAELYKSSASNLSTTTKKYTEKCHLPKKRFSYIYSQSEKLASSSKSSKSINYKSSTEYNLVKSVENRTNLNELDCSNLSPSIVKYAKKISKPEKQHSSLYSKRKCQPPKKRYSYLYSQSEAPLKTQSYTSLKPNYSNKYAHGLLFGDLSLVESSEKIPELYDSDNLDQSDKTSRYFGTYQISKNQHNYLYSQSKDVPSCYVNSLSSLHSNFDTEYAQGLSSQCYSHVVSAKSTEELYELNPIKQSTGTIIYAEKCQIPGNQDIYLYSQFKDDPSSSAKSYTALPSKFKTRYSHGLSSGEFALVESVKNTAGFYDSYALDLSARTKKNVEYQISENPNISSYCQTEVLPSSTKSYRDLDSYTENEHLFPSGNIYLGESAENESGMIYLKDLTDAEREERRKEQSKRRSEKYRLNCQEKMKQLEEEHHNLQEKNKTLHAEFDKLKQQWDKFLTISPCFTGKCETFKPLNEIKKSLQEPRTVLKEVESDEEDTIQTSKCKCKGQIRCETNKCSCYKSLISCTPRCHKNYSCRNH